MTQVASLSLYRFGGVTARAWAFAQMALARPGLARTPRLGFWKLLRVGHRRGLHPGAEHRVYAILATWPDLASAREGVAEAPVFARYRRGRAKAGRCFSPPPRRAGAGPGGPRSRPAAGAGAGPARRADPGDDPDRRSSRRFWGRVPAISDAHRRRPERALQDRHRRGAVAAPGHLLDLARRGGDGRLRPPRTPCRGDPGGPAEGWFREELYARFAVLGETAVGAGPRRSAPAGRLHETLSLLRHRRPGRDEAGDDPDRDRPRRSAACWSSATAAPASRPRCAALAALLPPIRAVEGLPGELGPRRRRAGLGGPEVASGWKSGRRRSSTCRSARPRTG